MKVIVLGSGPAGLMAAQGASDAMGVIERGHTIAIVSRKVKSALYGAQYLHAPIPGVTLGEPRTVSYQLRGSADDYRRKVYGQMYGGSVSPEDLAADHDAWDIRSTYDRLWTIWESYISDAEVDPIGLSHIITDEPDLIINSIPRPSLCHAGHAFGATQITAAGDAPALGIWVPYTCPPDTVVCNGDGSPSWYRMSRVFGHTTVEWPSSIAKVPVQSASAVQKPLSHSCDCWAETLPMMMHVGRYGRWEKGVLSHTAYFDAHERVKEMLAA